MCPEHTLSNLYAKWLQCLTRPVTSWQLDCFSSCNPSVQEGQPFLLRGQPRERGCSPTHVTHLLGIFDTCTPVLCSCWLPVSSSGVRIEWEERNVNPSYRDLQAHAVWGAGNALPRLHSSWIIALLLWKNNFSTFESKRIDPWCLRPGFYHNSLPVIYGSPSALCLPQALSAQTSGLVMGLVGGVCKGGLQGG